MIRKEHAHALAHAIVEGVTVDKAVIAFDHINNALASSEVSIPDGVISLLGSAAIQIAQAYKISSEDANVVLVQLLRPELS